MIISQFLSLVELFCASINRDSICHDKYAIKLKQLLQRYSAVARNVQWRGMASVWDGAPSLGRFLQFFTENNAFLCIFRRLNLQNRLNEVQVL